jgi:hypothetical protein
MLAVTLLYNDGSTRQQRGELTRGIEHFSHSGHKRCKHVNGQGHERGEGILYFSNHQLASDSDSDLNSTLPQGVAEIFEICIYDPSRFKLGTDTLLLSQR